MIVTVRLHTQITDESDSVVTVRLHKRIRLPFMPFDGLCVVDHRRGWLIRDLTYHLKGKALECGVQGFQHQTSRETQQLVSELLKEGWAKE